MTTVSDHATTDQWDSATEQAAPTYADETVERYETDEGVVFFDAENPLAWLEAATALSLREQV